jgi:hypothetical protein
MRRSGLAATIIVLTAISAAAASQSDNPKLPPAGTPYDQARKLLLAQHLTIAPDKPKKPDSRYPELDCGRLSGLNIDCQALFLFQEKNGWKSYVIVYVNKSRMLSMDADFAKPVDGLRAIPPPIPVGVPRLAADYLRARAQLRELGFKPITPKRGGSETCANIACRNTIPLPEAECTVDTSDCQTFWLSPDGRILKVLARGEVAPRVDYEKWTTRAELRELGW